MADGDDGHDVTLGELGRAVALLRADIKDIRAGISAEIRSLQGNFVPITRYEVEIQALRNDLADTKVQHDKEVAALHKAGADLASKQEKWKLALFTAIGAPIFMMMVGALLFTRVGT